MKKYIIANWKMNPDSWAEAEQILDSISEYFRTASDQEQSLVVCPPFVFVEEVSKLLQTSSLGQHVELGGQVIALTDQGSLTGEISGTMLTKLGTRYVIIGHSERRWKLGEGNEVVNQKLKAALQSELVPIVCVGERERDENYKEFLKQQIEATFADLSADDVAKCLVAYEPVWAISSNPNAQPDTPESTLESVAVIKDFLNTKHKIQDTRILYGGSVKAQNAKDFLSLDELSGVLVGGASLRKEEFVQILKQV